MDSRIKRIADNYGSRHQLAKAKEELLECIEAIEELEQWIDEGRDRAELADLVEHLAEESADVGIMLDQLAYLTRTENEREKMRDFKLQRQILRILEE